MLVRSTGNGAGKSSVHWETIQFCTLAELLRQWINFSSYSQILEADSLPAGAKGKTAVAFGIRLEILQGG